ncbi:MAG TPA: hypothetical protein VNZ57_12905 [Longimicrobiales bacterium]|nr:hypothetical protein [Longimicrobiales bacterium]
MILPNVRAGFGRAEAAYLVAVTTRGDDALRKSFEERLSTEGLDSVLDDPRTLNAVLTVGGVAAVPPRLVFYLLVRHALLENGIDDRVVADYLAALLLEFGKGGRARKVDEAGGESFDYLADIVAALTTADDRRAFLLRTHLGNFALWSSGLFPDYITARVRRRGAPGIEYYEELGASGYRLAADSSHAEAYGLHWLFRACAQNFSRLRISLNLIADRYLFPTTGDRIDRMLRQVADRFRDNAPAN